MSFWISLKSPAPSTANTVPIGGYLEGGRGRWGMASSERRKRAKACQSHVSNTISQRNVDLVHPRCARAETVGAGARLAAGQESTQKSKTLLHLALLLDLLVELFDLQIPVSASQSDSI